MSFVALRPNAFASSTWTPCSTAFWQLTLGLAVVIEPSLCLVSPPRGGPSYRELSPISTLLNGDGGSEWLNFGLWTDGPNMHYSDAARALADAVSVAANVRSEAIVLEAGGGRGDNALRLLRDFNISRVVGINFSEEETQAAQRRLHKAGLSHRGCVQQGDATDLLSVASVASVDCVVAVDCAYHFDSRRDFLRSASLVTKMDGQIAIADVVLPSNWDYDPDSASGSLLQDVARIFGIPRHNLVSASGLKADFEDAGFSEVRIQDVTDCVLKGFADHMGSKWQRLASVNILVPFLVWAVMTLIVSLGFFRYVIASGIRKEVKRSRGKSAGQLLCVLALFSVYSSSSLGFAPPPAQRAASRCTRSVGVASSLAVVIPSADAQQPLPRGTQEYAAVSEVHWGACVFVVLLALAIARMDMRAISSEVFAVLKEFLEQRVSGVRLGEFFAVMAALTLVGYQLDHSDGADVGASAFFINNKVRMSAQTSLDAACRYCLKVLLLLASLYIQYHILFVSPLVKRDGQQPWFRKESLCFLMGVVFIARVLSEMAFFYTRGVSWVEAFAEAGGVIPLSLASLAYAAAKRQDAHIGALETVGFLVFLFGTWLNLWADYSRFLWKSDPSHAGHLYMEGLFALSRHINYFGEVLSFVGFALASNVWSLWVPMVQGLGLAFFSVPELETYLSTKYATEWAQYTAEVPWQMIPYVW